MRDIVGHIVDTTEGYFPAFDAARSQADVASGPTGWSVWQNALKSRRSFRDLPQKEMVERLRTDFDKMMEIFEAPRPGRLDRADGLALLHGSGAGVLLPGRSS